MARNDRLKQTARDMFLSMGVLILPLALIFVLYPQDSKSNGPSVAPVDYSLDLTQARSAAPYAVLAPEGLPKGWTATAVHFDSEVYGPGGTGIVRGGAPGVPLRWELGFSSPDAQYVALDQVNAAPDKLLSVQAPNAAAVAGTDGMVTVGGFTWQKYDGKDRRALVRSEAATGPGPAVGSATGTGAGAAQAGAGVSVIVSGSASFSELEQFAGMLK